MLQAWWTTISLCINVCKKEDKKDEDQSCEMSQFFSDCILTWQLWLKEGMTHLKQPSYKTKKRN